MTATPPTPAEPPGTLDPEDVNVLYLAGQRPAEEGEWLLITEVDGLPGSVFSAGILPPRGRHGRGGDVLVRLTRAVTTAGLEAETIEVSVWAVISGRWSLLQRGTGRTPTGGPSGSGRPPRSPWAS